MVWRILAIIMIITGDVRFWNNIGAVAIMLLAVMGLSRQFNISPSKLLMPLSVAALLGGNMTLIGTPPYLVAIVSLQQAGLEPFGFFDYTPTGLLVLLIGLAYMLFLGYRLLPNRTSGEDITEGYDIPADLLTEVIVSEDSSLIDKPINQIRFGLENDTAVLYVRRGDLFLLQASSRRLFANDIMLIEGPHEQVVGIAERFDLKLRSEIAEDSVSKELQATGQLLEVTLSPKSRFGVDAARSRISILITG